MQSRRWFTLMLSLIIILSFAACSGGGSSGGNGDEDNPGTIIVDPSPEYPIMIFGVEINSRPGRVLTLAPSITEKLYDLGHQNRIVGISDFCDYPVSIIGTPRFGTAQIPDVNEIIDLAPHVILSAAPLPLDAASSLEDAGIPVIVFTHSFSLVDLEETYITIATLMDGRTTGRRIGERFVEILGERIDEIAAGAPAGSRGRAMYLRTLPFTIATGNTLEGELIERLGFENIASGQEVRWVFDPEEARSPEGRELFQSLDVIFSDERFAPVSAIQNSEFFAGLDLDISEIYVYIDSLVFERQSLRMLSELEKMVAR